MFAGERTPDLGSRAQDVEVIKPSQPRHNTMKDLQQTAQNLNRLYRENPS
jgi:hypothetical protein